MVTLFTAVTSMPARVLSKYLLNVETKGPTTATGSLLPYLRLVSAPEMLLPHQDESDLSHNPSWERPGHSSLRTLSDTEVFAVPEHALPSHASPLTSHISCSCAQRCCPERWTDCHSPCSSQRRPHPATMGSFWKPPLPHPHHSPPPPSPPEAYLCFSWAFFNCNYLVY